MTELLRMATKTPHYDICAAMCDSNRGIGLKGYFPWPYLKGDHDHYKKLTMTRVDPTKSIAFILGRRTWEFWYEEERETAGLHNIVISSTVQDGHHPSIHKVCSTFDLAIEYLTTPSVVEKIERIWVMGGSQNYQIAVNHKACNRLYLTRIFGDFEADVFFPEFEEKFRKISCSDAHIYEDNGVQYCFEVYKKL
ncbi:dihydrofolate reductase-like [Gigantopelta aegis]|uniref:dihydrofolate reductase-like n=1 Tax=Gigantopelta aegis TaxID=1735272 RepID=UPI001B88A65F|nr:dihydrofolate reductase-like [Gigantopelta aegis]